MKSHAELVEMQKEAFREAAARGSVLPDAEWSLLVPDDPQPEVPFYSGKRFVACTPQRYVVADEVRL